MAGDPPVPAALRRRGLKRATDNRAGRQLRVKGSLIWALFGPDLTARYAKRSDAATDPAPADRAG